MKKTVICFAACSAFAVLAALPLGAAELAHRWSFNGDYSDSAGGADAVKCGTYVSLYGGRVHMGYGSCSHATGYVDLGTNVLDTTAATIEIWARHDGVENWSRVFDYGADNAHYFTLCWTYGTNLNNDRAGMKNPDEIAVDGTMAPYEIGVDYHIAVTFERQGDATLVKWQRRDAKTGELQKSGSMTMSDGIQKIVNPVLYLGHSQYASDRDALAAYDEVRVWRGVLTDAQLAASAAAGPDAAITVSAEVPQFTPAEPPDPPAQRAAVPNGGFRMMTYNIQYCYDEASTIVPDRTAARIIAENPDFCCVNEVRDSAAHPEATMLAKLTGMHKTFGGNDSGSNGNLILSRERPISSETVFLKMAPLPVGWGDRYCVIAEFKDLCVAVTHLDTTNQGPSADVQASNAVAIATIRDAFARYTKPVFLCGDWNTRPNWENMARFNEFLEILSPTNGVRTYHGHNATGGHILDYISLDKAHKDDLYVANSFVVEDVATSDHNPVIVELYCRPAAADLGWVDERFLTTGRTGTWSPSVAWNGGTWTAELGGGHAFTPTTPSGGNVVTVDVTAAFDAVPQETATPGGSAQCALWLGTNGNFQVWTKDGWVDAAAEEVTPRTGVEYTFRFVFDYTAGTYSVSVQDGGEWRALAATGGASAFSLAASGTSISRIVFAGEGALRSILGEYVAVEGFSAEEAVVLKDNAQKILSAAEAEWLNKCAGGKTSVAGKIAAVSLAEFDTAHLLNLDITDDERSYTFEITDISVGKDVVTVEVELVRKGAIAQTIYGSLRFYGAATLEAFKSSATLLGNAELSNEQFGEGETATATIQIDGETPPAFFEARIEVKSEK